MIQLAALFQDRAIVQRGQPVAVWGWGPPRTRIRVTLGPLVGHGLTSARGHFEVWLPPPPEGEPLNLTVDAPHHPEVTPATAHDLRAGEVWIAAGQSNMAMTLAECGDLAAEVIATAGDSGLRFFTVSSQAQLGPQDDVHGSWQLASPQTAAAISAVAWHFGAKLRRELGVPVGMIVSAVGGTPIEAWLSRQAHARSLHLSITTADYECHAHSPIRWDRAGSGVEGCPASILPPDPGISPQAADWAAPGFDDSAWPVMPLPSTWQQHGHPFSGVFWFRLTLDLPAAWRGHELALDLGAADKQDITFANGMEIGRTGSGFEDGHWNRPRRYMVPAALTNTDRLVIAVRIYSFLYDGGLHGPASGMNLSCPSRPADAPIALAREWRYAIEHNFGHVPGDHDPGHLTPQSPHILFDNMIEPLAPFGLRGALWYQGERNTAHAGVYADLLSALVDDWRRLWGRGDFPFLVVQLPAHGSPCPHDPDSAWARLRESQLHVASSVPGVALVVTLDVGEAYDIHPKNKAPVGQRLAGAALVRVYARSGEASGPFALHARRTASEVRIVFDQSLVTLDGAPPQTVCLRDASGVWHSAAARIEGNELAATATACPAPVEIAYAWADNPVGANLANLDGHPASPLRISLEATVSA